MFSAATLSHVCNGSDLLSQEITGEGENDKESREVEIYANAGSSPISFNSPKTAQDISARLYLPPSELEYTYSI